MARPDDRAVRRQPGDHGRFARAPDQAPEAALPVRTAAGARLTSRLVRSTVSLIVEQR